MQMLTRLAALVVLVYQHRVEIAAWFMASLVAWVPFATFLAKFIPRPEPVHGWRNALKRGLFDLFVDTPALIAAIGRVGIMGGRWNFPGIPSRTPDANPIKLPAVKLPPAPPAPPKFGAAPMFLALVLVGASMTSCAPTSAYVTAEHVRQGCSDSLRAAYDVWRAADRAAQDNILNSASTAADYKARMITYRAIETAVDEGFVTAREALRTLSLALAAAGAVKQSNFAAAEADAMAALVNLGALLEKYGFPIKLPAPPTSSSRPALYTEVASCSL